MLPPKLLLLLVITTTAVKGSLLLVEDGDTFVDLAARSDDPFSATFRSGVTNAQQRIDAVVHDLRTNKRPGASIATNLIAGLDGQIDNVLGLISNTLSQVTLGISDIPFNFILGPTFQSITDGAEVLIGNTLGGAIDLAAVPAMHVLSGSLASLANTAVRINMPRDAQRFSALSRQVSAIAVQGQQQTRRRPAVRAAAGGRHGHYAKREEVGSGVNLAAQAITHIQSAISNIVKDFDKSSDSDVRPPTEAVAQFVADLDTQVSKGIETLSSVVSAVGPLPESASFALTAPFFQSASRATDKLSMALAGGYVDPSLSGALSTLSSKVQVLAATADQYPNNKQFATSLALLNRKVQSLADYSHPENQLQARGITDGFASAVTNAQQHLDAFFSDLNSPNARPGTQAFVNLITGIDGQIDNILGLTSNALSGVTGGLSDIPFNFILGPTFQSITDGVEVLIGNVGGSVLDVALVPVMHALSNNVVNLANVANEHGMTKQAITFSNQAKRIQMIATPSTHRATSHRYQQQAQGGYQHQQQGRRY